MKYNTKQILEELAFHTFYISLVVLTGIDVMSAKITSYIFFVMGFFYAFPVLVKYTIPFVYLQAMNNAAEKHKGHEIDDEKRWKIMVPLGWIINALLFILCMFYNLYIPAVVIAVMGFAKVIMLHDVKLHLRKTATQNRHLQNLQKKD